MPLPLAGNCFKIIHSAPWVLVILLLSAPAPAPASAADPTPGSRRALKVPTAVHRDPIVVHTRTGGALEGVIVDYTGHGLVILREGTPYVFAWTELKSGNAYATFRSRRVLERGGEKMLSAEDHYQLGLFALDLGRRDLAGPELRQARQLDPAYRLLIRDALAASRALDEPPAMDTHPLARDPGAAGVETRQHRNATVAVGADLAQMAAVTAAPGPSAKRRAAVRDAYLRFGREVQEVMGSGVVLIETDHFLIWTDWKEPYRQRLATWFDSMYAALCAQFNLDPKEDIFLAKCPVFCWRSHARFRKFAQHFDGYGGLNAIGYTRSIEENGHVHMVLSRQGRSAADFDRVACTLVHEGTHAFVHRLFSSRLIPHWVNEGYADLMAERVLADRCPNGENAALLARQFVRHDWPIADLMESVGPIDVHQYPLAHSVIAYLEGRAPRRFAGLVEDLKAGQTFAAALAARYDGLTLRGLETQWREAVRADDPQNQPVPATTAPVPWRADR